MLQCYFITVLLIAVMFIQTRTMLYAQPPTQATGIISDTLHNASHSTSVAPPGDAVFWLSGSYGQQRNWGGDLGFRYKFIGVGIAFADLDNDDNVKSIPDYNDWYIPHSSYTTEAFGGTFRGFNLFGFWDANTWLALYGSIGWYGRTYTYLDRSTVTYEYYKSTRDDVTVDDGIAGGAGIHVTLFRALVIGGGYNTTTGALASIGWRF